MRACRRKHKPVRQSQHPDASGDVLYALKPNFMFSSATAVTTHGSPYDHHCHGPLLVYGPKRYAPGSIDARVEITSIAPTLASATSSDGALHSF